ncbi:MAG: hypothetical protein KF882_08005 [Bacteroidia bacterium]|nr:hypothetical protein [Bacteroidia bacterium]MCO5254488.1 hypothetical protein [Bacteroidota bacterium]
MILSQHAASLLLIIITDIFQANKVRYLLNRGKNLDIQNSKIDLINPNRVGVVFEVGKYKEQNVILMDTLIAQNVFRDISFTEIIGSSIYIEIEQRIL